MYLYFAKLNVSLYFELFGLLLIGYIYNTIKDYCFDIIKLFIY